MLTELHQKSGNMCQQARDGLQRCPMIARTDSEDVITGHLVHALRLLNPTWWVPDLLNRGLQAPRFRRQYFRNFKIEPWVNKPRFPRNLVPWNEGSTQVDFCITWENPATTIYVEMKYGSDLSSRTSGNYGQHNYPADQLIRNIRVGLLECGYFTTDELFSQTTRDFAVLVISPREHHQLVTKYRKDQQLLNSIPHSEKITSLPIRPFVGELSYLDFVRILRQQQPQFTKTERKVIDQFADYLGFKQSTTPQFRLPTEYTIDKGQISLPVLQTLPATNRNVTSEENLTTTTGI
ncbi:MAG: hypothetical protein JNJ77_06830 [Planctomycetia bacterium]|nr:hypothetical protein [Planctomycetia bacterium]